MAKTISVNEYVYAELASTSGKLTMLARKPISMGMTILGGLAILRNWLEKPQVKDALKKLLEETEIPSPEEFDAMWEETFQKISVGMTK